MCAPSSAVASLRSRQGSGRRGSRSWKAVSFSGGSEGRSRPHPTDRRRLQQRRPRRRSLTGPAAASTSRTSLSAELVWRPCTWTRVTVHSLCAPGRGSHGVPHTGLRWSRLHCFPNVPRCCRPRPATSGPRDHAEHKKATQTPCPPPQLFTAAATRHTWHVSRLHKSRYNRVNGNTEIGLFCAGCPDLASPPAGTRGPWGAPVTELTVPDCVDPALRRGVLMRTSDLECWGQLEPRLL